MKLTLLFFVGCTAQHVAEPDGSLRADGPLSIDSRGSDTPDYTCTPNGGLSCCVFAPSNCSAGYSCQYDWNYDESLHGSGPSQAAGGCASDGTLPLGATCDVHTVGCPGCTQPTCGEGAWCAYDANSGTTGTGICRRLCDPLDQATHGCAAGQACEGMPYCADASQWPNCPPATNTHLGVCR